MRKWLLDKKGGNVPPQNLILCLSRLKSDKIPAGVKHRGAKQQDIIDSIVLVERDYGGLGDNFFFYYAGHGVNFISSSPDASAIVPSDLRPGAAGRFNTNVMLSLASILAYLKNLKFQYQFFFVDACRNIPYTKEFWKGGFNPGSFPGQDTGARDFTLIAKNQFILYSTSPGFASIEKTPPKPYGIFTNVLLGGLGSGANGAKVYDDGLDKYRVTVSSLFEYIKSEVEKKKEQAGKEWEDAIQVPTWNILANENPELSVYDGNFFGEVKLHVDVKPAEIEGAKIFVYTADQVRESKKRLGNKPVRFSLMPRKYGLVTTAPSYQQDPGREVVQLWGHSKKVLYLKKMTPGKRVLGGRNIIGKVKGRSRGIDLPSYEKTAMLTVRCDDPLAPLEITNSSGKSLEVGTGQIIKVLLAGDYQARLIDGEGQPTIVKDVILTPGMSETVTLVPPEPFAKSDVGKELTKNTGFDVGGKFPNRIPMPTNTLGVSESNVGPIANPELSTILALAGAASTFAENDWFAGRLRKIGVRELATLAPGAPSGIQVLFAFDSKHAARTNEYVDNLLVRLGSIEGSFRSSMTKFSLPVAHGLASYLQAGEPTPCSVSVKLSDQDPIVFYSAMLRERMTLLIFHQKPNGQIRVFQYMLKIKNSKPNDEAQLIRMLDLLQRFYMTGQFDYAYKSMGKTLHDMLKRAWIDPIFGVVAGYLMLRLGKSRDLDEPSCNMVRLYSSLPDSHIIRAEYLDSVGKYNDAKETYIDALNAGIPVFADGVDILSRAGGKYDIRHPRLELLHDLSEHRIRGMIWTAKHSKE